MQLTHDAMLLGLESQRVMALRLMKLSRGSRAAHAEALRMFSEKTTALAEAGTTLARGGSAGTVIRRYRTQLRPGSREEELLPMRLASHRRQLAWITIAKKSATPA